MNNFTYNEALEHLSKYDVITFDVFDTLIARTVIKPTDVFLIVNAKAKTQGILPNDNNFSFFKVRQEAEQKGYAQFGDATTLNVVYDILNKDYNYSKEQCEWLMQTEIETEISVAIPRKDMLSLVNDLRKHEKDVVLISDMYLSSDVIRQLLIKCGYDNDLNIWVSCEKSASKHNGNLWTLFFVNIPDKVKTIHVGDNEWADSKALKTINRDSFLIKKGYDAFSDSVLYAYLSDYLNDDISNSLVLGYLINAACFNSPFKNSKETDNIEAIWMGYAFACFMDWLNSQRDDSLLLFVTREGYLLKPLYEKYCEGLGVVPQANSLFYASRAATLAASASTETDIEDILSIAYEGTLGHFFKSRFNYELSDIELANFKIKLPEESKKVLNYIKPFLSDILKNGNKQKKAYQTYINEIRTDKNQSLTVVDVGYNGTIQFGLSKITGETVYGKYMFVNSKAIPIIIKNHVSSLRTTTDGAGHPIHENLLFLEAVMQVPFGQLQRMSEKDEKSLPVFNLDGNFSEHIPVAQKNFLSFVELAACWKKELGDYFTFNFNLAEIIWITLLKFNYIPQELLDSFWLADDFSGTPIWKYNSKKQEWQGKYSNSPLSFVLAKGGQKIDSKYRIKNLVKKYIPASAYEVARKIWIKYIK